MKTSHGPSLIGALVWAAITTIPTDTRAGLPPHVEGDLLVKFRGGPRGEAAARVQAAMRHEVKRHFDFIGWQHIRLPAGMSVEEGLARYRNLPGVMAVEPNGIEVGIQLPPGGRVFAAEAVGNVRPNDPMLSQQWGLHQIGASNAWAASIGSTNVVVAVIDTGINYNHEDLRENMWRNPAEIPGNGLDDDGNGFVDDIYGIDTADDLFGNDSDPMDVNTQDIGYHGTACAGIIGAVGNNGRGITGANWTVRLMAIRAVQQNNFISQADRIQAWEYVLLMKQRGVNLQVVSMSWGGTNFNAAARDACVAVGNAGIVQVAAAGNSTRDNDVIPFYPASYPASNMISVAASDRVDALASFSNYGRTNVDLAAPGLEIVTTYAPGTNSYELFFNGTSAATPFVSGAAALLVAMNSNATPTDVKTALLESTDMLPAFTNRMVSNGRLNLGSAAYHSRVRPDTSPLIAVAPQSQTRVETSNAVFTVIVYGSAPLRYQWQKQGAPLPGATNVTLSLTNVTPNHAGDYSMVVSNPFGAITSSVATLTVLTFPRLVGPLTPLRIGAVIGETVTFSVETTGTLPIGYRWRHLQTNGTSANLTNVVLNEHRSFLSLTANTNSAGAYTIVLTNVAQPTSAIQRTNALLTMLADTDSNGLPDVWETAFGITAPELDADGDGVSNRDEYVAGTNPTNSLDYLRVIRVERADGNPGGVTLEFMAMSNLTYTVERTDQLAPGAWSKYADIVARAANRVEVLVDPSAGPRGYYRLVTPRQP